MAEKNTLAEDLKLTFKKHFPQFFQKFNEAKLKDGSVIKYEGETPMAGMPVVVVTPQGELPAPDGEHMMEDGTILIVKGGVIAEVKSAAPQEQPVEQAQAPVVESVKPNPVKETRVVEKVYQSMYRTKKSDSKLFKQLQEEYLTDKFNSDEFAFAEAVEELKKEGIQFAECVAASIKNGLAKYMITSKNCKDIFEAVSEIDEYFTKNPIEAYLFSQSIGKLVNEENVKALEKKLADAQVKTEKMEKQLEAQTKFSKDLFELVEKYADSPSEKTTKPKESTKKSADDFEARMEKFRLTNYSNLINQ